MRRTLQRWYWDQMAAWCILFRQRDRGIAYYMKMLAADPRDTLALASLAYRYAEAGRKHDALEMYERVIAITPGDCEAHFSRGFLLQELGKHDDALAAFRRSTEINAGHDRAHYGIGLSLIALRRFDEAVAPLERNTELQPMSPYGWYQLARVEVDLNQREKAQKILNHLMTFEPKVAKQLARETGLQLPG